MVTADFTAVSISDTGGYITGFITRIITDITHLFTIIITGTIKITGSPMAEGSVPAHIPQDGREVPDSPRRVQHHAGQQPFQMPEFLQVRAHLLQAILYLQPPEGPLPQREPPGKAEPRLTEGLFRILQDQQVVILPEHSREEVLQTPGPNTILPTGAIPPATAIPG